MKKRDTYPLPQSQFAQLTYNSKSHTICRLARDNDGNDIEVPISTPFGVLARLRRADENDSSGLRIRVCGMNGEDREADIARRDLTINGGQAIRALMYDLGMRTFNDGEKHVIAFLKATDPDQEIVMVTRRG